MEKRLVSNLPRPSKALIALMVVIGCIWVMFAMGLNWGGSGRQAFGWLTGDSAGIFHGEVWRLFTAPLMHDPNSPTHPIFVLLMFYFFLPALEEAWGPKRLFLFLFGSAAFAFFLESLVHLLLPGLANAQWFGGMVMADAALVAWAIANREKVIHFMMVIPLKPLVMVGLMLAWHVLLLIARKAGPEGMIAPFGAALAGWLFCDSGPARRAYLKLRLRRLQSEVSGMSKQRTARTRSASHLKVIPGGKDDNDDDRMLH